MIIEVLCSELDKHVQTNEILLNDEEGEEFIDIERVDPFTGGVALRMRRSDTARIENVAKLSAWLRSYRALFDVAVIDGRGYSSSQTEHGVWDIESVEASDPPGMTMINIKRRTNG